MKPSRQFAKWMITAALPLAALSTAHAAAYTFNVDYFGGGVAALASGSDNVTSVILQDGDTFNYRLIAAGSGAWTSTGGSIFPAFALIGSNYSNSTLNFTFNLLNNGATVFTYSEVNASTCCAHLGTNTVNFPSAVFDEFELLVTNLNIGNPSAASSLLPYPGRGPEQYSPNVLSFDASTAVPEPASWALVFAALGLAGATTRRKRRVAA